MIARILVLLLPLVVVVSSCAHRSAGARGEPGLVVLISVDQLRPDLLERYDSFFTAGLRRLVDGGAVFSALHDHAGTDTAPGHAVLSTGVAPARNGIVANAWSERVGEEWVRVYSVEDSLSPIVGFPERPGRSPRNLLRTGLADWMVAASPATRVAAVGGKDRSAILLAGQAAGDVYWFDTETGRFITSQYYARSDAPWVDNFNTTQLATYWDTVWTHTAPAAARARARPDTADFEADGVHTFFPHRYSVHASNWSFSQWVGSTPFVDAAILGLAKEAVRARKLGRRADVDFLGIGLSQVDAVGHRFGPLSQEQLDNLLRLDRALGDFLTFLDEYVGARRWIVALSSDHGVMTMPEWREIQGRSGYRVSAGERERMMEGARAAAARAPTGAEPEAVSREVMSFSFVADAIPFEQLEQAAVKDSFARLAYNSYHPDRARGALGTSGVDLRLTEGTIMSAIGTTHGSLYRYDRAVPVIFFGSGIHAGHRSELVRTVDFAPTLARIAGIPVPDDLDGRAVVEPSRFPRLSPYGAPRANLP